VQSSQLSVQGLLEIIAGELETGVTRFIAVAVKTFVLTLGSCIGFQVVVYKQVFEAWVSQDKHCNTIDLDAQWWRIPLYLLCSASALGQYRTPLVNYWRGLVVQLAGYEVQYQMFKYFAMRHEYDFLDTAISNITGAAAAVVAACALSFMVDSFGYYYNARLLMRTQKVNFSKFGEFMYSFTNFCVRMQSKIGLHRTTTLFLMENEKDLRQSVIELQDPHHPRKEIRLKPEEEAGLVEAIVNAENINVWALLMPAVYQLVPGSLIAKLWYNAVFPPPLVETIKPIPGTEYFYTDVAANPIADNVFYGLWVISTSLALGLLIGFALVQTFTSIFGLFFSLFSCCKRTGQTSREEQLEDERVQRLRFRQQEVMTTAPSQEDPEDNTESPVVTEEVDERGKPPPPPLQGGILSTRVMQGIMNLVEEDDPADNDAVAHGQSQKNIPS